MINLTILSISLGYIVFSSAVFDVINNSIGAFVFLSVPNILSKFFLYELNAYHNQIYRDEEFLVLELPEADYQSLHYMLQIFSVVYISITAI